MTDKTVTAWLVVDWKSERVKARKTEPHISELGTNELKAKVDADVSVPDVDVPTLSLEINVPEPRVYAATLEAIDDEDLPEWADVALETVDDTRVAFESAGNAPEWKTVVDEVTVDVLRDAPGRPDVENVRDFVDTTARDAHDVDAPDEVDP
jgi:hypothetical protein